MVSSAPLDSCLTRLQRELLEAFFERDEQFFLTGGAALGGFHLRHRASDDLDLFAVPPCALDDAARVVTAAAGSCGATARSLRRFPEFCRLLVERGQESTVVDLVIDHAPQIVPEKVLCGRIRLDSLREIAANKVCALLGRNEAKDLVDLKAILEREGDLEQALRDAETKDAGASAATLAYVLGQWSIGPQAVLPGGVDPGDAERFRLELVERLARLAFTEATRRAPTRPEPP